MYVVFHVPSLKDNYDRDLPDTDTIVVKLEKITDVQPDWTLYDGHGYRIWKKYDII